MKFASLVFLLSTAPAFAAPSLLGTWQSDHDMTMNFIRQNVKMLQKTEEFLDSLVGHMTITYTKRQATVSMPDLDVVVREGKRPFKGFNETTPYEILYQVRKP